MHVRDDLVESAINYHSILVTNSTTGTFNTRCILLADVNFVRLTLSVPVILNHQGDNVPLFYQLSYVTVGPDPLSIDYCNSRTTQSDFFGLNHNRHRVCY